MFLPPPRVDPPAGEERSVRNIWESDAFHEKVTLGKGRAGHPETDDPTFSTENGGRNIVLAFNIDGFQPWKHVQYSITPSVGMILNLPENLRHRSEYLIMASIIPGPKEPKDFDHYFQFLVRELTQYSRPGNGFEIQDPLRPSDAPKTQIRIKLLNICADLPAFGHVMCQQTAGAHHGCIKCHLVVSDT